LTNEELETCNAVVRIPTAVEFSSMNMAQAVCVLAYELSIAGYQKNKPVNSQPERNRPTGLENEELSAQLGGLLENIEFSRKFNKELVLRQLISFYKRADPTKREADLLRGILYKLNQSLASHQSCDSSGQDEKS
jgi:tRNA C32,U32 (ribose-2'-O)-methylase TrmJ